MLSISQIRVFLRVMTTLQRRLNHLSNKCSCQPFHRCTTNSNRRHNLILSSSFTDDTISSFLQQVNHNQNHMNRNGTIIHGNYMWFVSYPISFLLCCYCLACIVLIKMMLPTEYRTNFSNALFMISTKNLYNHSTTNSLFTIRTYTIDVIYTITALITGTILAISLSIMRSNVRRIHYCSKFMSSNHATEVP
jgi:hypothetical protein